MALISYFILLPLSIMPHIRCCNRLTDKIWNWECLKNFTKFPLLIKRWDSFHCPILPSQFQFSLTPPLTVWTWEKLPEQWASDNGFDLWVLTSELLSLHRPSPSQDESGEYHLWSAQQLVPGQASCLWAVSLHPVPISWWKKSNSFMAS